MRILITGASGFLGGHLIAQALERGHDVVAMVRGSSDTTSIETLAARHAGRLEKRNGDMLEPATFPALVSGCDAVIHAAAATSEHTNDLGLSRRVNRDGTRALVDAARSAGVAHVVLVSSQSAHEGNSSAYGLTKRESEEAVRGGGVPWSIVRPGVIYGPEKRGIFAKMQGLIEKLPIVPLIGNGRYLQEPVHVDDVAWACVRCLDVGLPAQGQVFGLGGADRLAFRDVLRLIMEHTGKKRIVLPLPVWVCRIIATVGETVLSKPPITHSNIDGLLTAPPLDGTSARDILGYKPRAFEQGLRDIRGS